MRMNICVLLAFLMVLLNCALYSQTLALQGFENSANDTWAYTANPSDFVPYFWGRNNQPQGGASAQSGSWYWASWLMEPIEASLTFAIVPITPGTQHSLNFHYYSRNLNPATDQLKICMEYDTGTEWNNWMQLLSNTQEWSPFSVNIPIDATTIRVKIVTHYTNTNMDKYVHWDNFSIKAEEAEFTAPIIYNTSVAQRTDGSKMVDISYDLFDANGDLCEVSLKLSSNGGATFTYIPDPANLSGDIGEPIAPGTGKAIVWNAGAEGIDFDGDYYMLQFFAEDGQIPIPDGFVYVPGGTFTMGRTTGTGEDDELPTHSVTLNSFYMGTYEVTQAEYAQYMQPSYSLTSSDGLGANYPAYYISWYAILKYCNLRSMAEGLTPVYTISGSTNPANWGSVPTSGNSTWNAAICNWSANGYRLPTEAEWEYAARGATNIPDYLYSGSDDINAVAWYNGNNSPNGSKPVGTKAPNGLGLYDMSGNLWERCWDWLGSYSSSPQNNPTGPASGPARVSRGGDWDFSASICRVASRDLSLPYFNSYYIGFRLCRAFP